MSKITKTFQVKTDVDTAYILKSLQMWDGQAIVRHTNLYLKQFIHVNRW